MDFFCKLPAEFQKDIIQNRCIEDEKKMLETVETSWEASKVFQQMQSVHFQEGANAAQLKPSAGTKQCLTESFESFLNERLAEMSLHSAQKGRQRDQTPYYKNKDKSREKRRSHSRDRSHSRESRRRNSFKQDNYSRSRSRSHTRSHDQDRSRPRNRSRSAHRYDRSRSSS